MGLLDVLNSEDGRLGLGLLAAGSARSDGAGLGQRLSEAIGSVDQWKAQQEAAKFRKLQQEHMAMQMAQAQEQMARQKRIQEGAGQFFKPGTPAIPAYQPMDSMLPPEMRTGAQPMPAQSAKAPSFDAGGFAQFLAQNGEYEKAIPLLESLKPKETKLSAGEKVFVGGKEAYGNTKAPDLPGEVQEYQFAVSQGEKRPFSQWKQDMKKAGATSVALKVDNKTGESLAGQVGPMAKDSRVQTQGAVKMYDAADRLEKALNSNLVASGPGATQIQTVKQVIQKIGGGTDEGIRQTRQAIKSLAQMSVEARKQLQGQGQVTESEALAVAKADAGDINDLTPGELRDLVTLTKRAAHFQAKSHQELLGTLGGKDETRNLVPFYGVQGLEPLLNHKPELPQIGGGGWSIKPVGQ